MELGAKKEEVKAKFVLFLSLLYLVKYGRRIGSIMVTEEKLLSSQLKSNLLLFYTIRRSTSSSKGLTKNNIHVIISHKVERDTQSK